MKWLGVGAWLQCPPSRPKYKPWTGLGLSTPLPPYQGGIYGLVEQNPQNEQPSAVSTRFHSAVLRNLFKAGRLALSGLVAAKAAGSTRFHSVVPGRLSSPFRIGDGKSSRLDSIPLCGLSKLSKHVQTLNLSLRACVSKVPNP